MVKNDREINHAEPGKVVFSGGSKKIIGDVVAPIFLAEVNVHTPLGQYSDLRRSMVCRIILIQ